MENCNLCLEAFDSDELIEVENGLIKLKTGVVKLSDVIFNVFSSKVNSVYCAQLNINPLVSSTPQIGHISVICMNCKAQIINFYNFKESVKINLDPIDSQKISIIDEVREFLCQSDNKFAVLKSYNVLTIHPDNTAEDEEIEEEIILQEQPDEMGNDKHEDEISVPNKDKGSRRTRQSKRGRSGSNEDLALI